jgi:hypothetical protein
MPLSAWLLAFTATQRPYTTALCWGPLTSLIPPLAACPTNYAAASPACPRCNGVEEESVEHVLLDCPATHAIRADERFSHLFMGPWPQVARLRTFMHNPHQYALAKFIHACLQ